MDRGDRAQFVYFEGVLLLSARDRLSRREIGRNSATAAFDRVETLAMRKLTEELAAVRVELKSALGAMPRERSNLGG
jgi:hypothetical protein